MSGSTNAQEFGPVSPSPANAFSDTEPSEDEKRQIKERINQNLQKLYQDAEELFKRRMQGARSDEERARLEGDLKLETGRIRSLGAEEYHTQLELERQKRKWAMGLPIDDSWREMVLREQNKILESFKSNQGTVPATNGVEHNEHPPEGRMNAGIRQMPIQESPPSAHPEISQRRSSRAREERSSPRVRRESDAIQSATKEEHRHATVLDPFIEPWTARHNGDEPEPPLYYSSSRSRVSSTTHLERSEEDRTASRSSDRVVRVAASSPVKHEIWRPNATAEEETSSGKRNLTRRGSTASQRSIGSTSIRSLTTEPIPERPDMNEHEAVIRRFEGEPTRSSIDKGKERSLTFQIATEPNEQEEEPVFSAPPISRVPNSAPAGRFPDRPPNYGTLSRANSAKLPKLDDDDRAFPYKSPRRHASKSSFTSESVDPRLGPAIEEQEAPQEWDFGFRGMGHNAQRPIISKPSLNDLHEDDGRYGSDLFNGRRSRIDGMSSKDDRDREEDNWTGSVRARGSRSYMPSNPFVTDDSYISYNRHSPESTRPTLSRGASFNRSVEEYDISPSREGHHRPHNQPPPSSSIPINRVKRSSTDDYGAPNWRAWNKPEGRYLAEGRSPYDYYTSPSSLSASYQVRHHDFGGRESKNHRGIENPVQESDEESFKRRFLELQRAERTEATKREEAERLIQEAAKKQKEDERRLKEKMEEVRKKEEETRKKEEEVKRWVEEARRKEEEAKRNLEEAQKLREDARRKEEEARRLEEEGKRREEEARRNEEETRLKAEEARSKEEEAAKKEDEARRKEDEAKKKELEGRKKEREAHKKELEAKRKESEARRKEFEAKRLEDEARRMEEEARRREEETEKREEDIERREEEVLHLEEEMRQKVEEIKRREEELNKREEDLERREAESRLEDERQQQVRLQEEEMRRQQEEEEDRQREVELTRRREVEAKLHEEAETIKRREAEIIRRREELTKKEQERKKREGEKRRREEERRQRLEEDRRLLEEERQRLDDEIRQREHEEASRRGEAERKLQEEERRRQERQEEERKRQERQEDERKRQERQEEERRRREIEEMRRQELEELHRQELEELHRQELEELHRQEMEAVRRQQEEEKRKQEEEVRREQERIHEEIMRRQWEKQRLANDPAHTMLQGAYERQREEIQKRKGEERKQSVDTSFVSSSPTASISPLSSGRASAGPQRQGSMSGSAWTPTSGFAWKTASSASPTTSPSSSTTSSNRSSNSSATSATSAASTNSNSRPKPATTPAPPILESEWARRQAEQAKEQQEKFRLEQEKKENQRLAEEANKQLTGKDLVQLYQHHEARWKDLNTFDVLRWETFPWPMLRRPKTAEDIMESTIYAYLFTKFYPDNNKSEKDRVKEHIKRWHPDKFNTKYLPKVIENDKERVKEGAGAVVRGLNAILTKMNEPSKLFG